MRKDGREFGETSRFARNMRRPEHCRLSTFQLVSQRLTAKNTGRNVQITPYTARNI
jgi:hypothetical protein